jgi:hypothetical protein
LQPDGYADIVKQSLFHDLVYTVPQQKNDHRENKAAARAQVATTLPG